MKLISTIRFVFILASGFVGKLAAQAPSLEASGALPGGMVHATPVCAGV